MKVFFSSTTPPQHSTNIDPTNLQRSPVLVSNGNHYPGIPTNYIANKNFTYTSWSSSHSRSSRPSFGEIAFRIRVTVRNRTLTPPAVIKSNITRRVEPDPIQYSTAAEETTTTANSRFELSCVAVFRPCSLFGLTLDALCSVIWS